MTSYFSFNSSSYSYIFFSFFSFKKNYIKVFSRYFSRTESLSNMSIFQINLSVQNNFTQKQKLEHENARQNHINENFLFLYMTQYTFNIFAKLSHLPGSFRTPMGKADIFFLSEVQNCRKFDTYNHSLYDLWNLLFILKGVITPAAILDPMQKCYILHFGNKS